MAKEDKIQERFDNENRVLLTLATDGGQWEISRYITSDNFFRQKEANDLFSWMKNFYNDSPDYLNKYGNTADIYAYLISHNAGKRVKEYFVKLMSSQQWYASVVTTENMLRFLTECNLDDQMNLLWSQCQDVGWDKLESMVSGFSGILERFTNSGVFSEDEVNNEQIIQEFLENLDKKRKGLMENNFIPTGIKNLDEDIKGIPKNNLSIVAGRPSMGKTAFTLQLMREWVLSGKKVGYISMETDIEQIMERWLSSISKVSQNILQNPVYMTDQDYEKIKESTLPLINANYKFDCGAYHTVDSIKAKALYWKKKYDINIIIIDHLGLISIPKSRTRDEELGQACKALRQFAKDQQMTIIVLSQLNRGVDNREDKRPMLADLRESGNLEADAEMILFMYWGVKARDVKSANTDIISLGSTPHYVDPKLLYQVVTGKNKRGKSGITYLEFLPKTQRFIATTKGTLSYVNGQYIIIPAEKARDEESKYDG